MADRTPCLHLRDSFHLFLTFRDFHPRGSPISQQRISVFLFKNHCEDEVKQISPQQVTYDAKQTAIVLL